LTGTYRLARRRDDDCRRRSRRGLRLRARRRYRLCSSGRWNASVRNTRQGSGGCCGCRWKSGRWWCGRARGERDRQGGREGGAGQHLSARVTARRSHHRATPHPRQRLAPLVRQGGWQDGHLDHQSRGVTLWKAATRSTSTYAFGRRRVTARPRVANPWRTPGTERPTDWSGLPVAGRPRTGRSP